LTHRHRHSCASGRAAFWD